MTNVNEQISNSIFDFNEADFNKNEIVALQLLQDPLKLEDLIIKAQAFELVDYLVNNAGQFVENYIETKRMEYQELVENDEMLVEISNRTQNPKQMLKVLREDTVEKYMSDFKLTISPKFQQYINTDKSKPKRKNKEKEDFIVVTINGKKHGFSGGAHIPQDIVDFMYDKVKSLKSFDEKISVLTAETDKVKVAGAATPAKLKSFVYSVLSIKTTRFKIGDLETNCRGVIRKDLTELLIEKMKDPKVKLEDFYIENDFDKAFPEIKEKAFESIKKDIAKRK